MIEFHQATRKALKGQLTRSQDNAEWTSAMATQTVLIERALQRLERVVVQLERLDLETADQRRLLLAHAKGVSVSLVDADLLATLFDDFSQRFEQWLSSQALDIASQVALFLGILFCARLLARFARAAVHRVDCEFGISYGDSIEKAERILSEVVASIKQVLPSPEPVIRVHRLGESSVDFVVRPWVKTEDYWETYWALHREVKLRFDAEGISIPLPQRDVHLFERTK